MLETETLLQTELRTNKRFVDAGVRFRPMLPLLYNVLEGFSGEMSKTLGKFWACRPLAFQLFSLGFRLPASATGNAGFTCAHPELGLPASITFSDSLCTDLLQWILGNGEHSPYSQFSGFEHAVLTRFGETCWTSLSQLVTTPAVTAPASLFPVKSFAANEESPDRAKNIYAVWLIRLPAYSAGEDAEYSTLGKITLTLPIPALSSKVLQQLKTETGNTSQTERFKDPFFASLHALSRIALGTTRISLDDLAALEVGDLVVLDASDTRKMSLLQEGQFAPHSDSRGWFPVQLPMWLELLETVHPGAHIHQVDQNFPSGKSTEAEAGKSIATINDMDTPIDIPFQEVATGTSGATKPANPLWDQLMIDVRAEFMPVRLPLQQLKRMTEGQLVEVGNLVGNQVRLHIEGKTLATGQLVVVDDQFAVRIQALAPGAAPDNKESPEETTSGIQSKAAAPHSEQPSKKMDVPLSPEAPVSESQPVASPEPVQSITRSEVLDDTLEAFLNEDFDNDMFNEDQWK